MGQSERDAILRTFKEQNIPFEHFTHEPVYTSQQAMAARKGELHNGVKAMVLETERGVVLALLAADLKMDLKRFGEILEFKKVKLASKEIVLEKTGCEPGAVPPFWFSTPLPIYLDESVFDHEWAEFNIGLLTESVRIRTADLRKILPQRLLKFASIPQQ
ncbi:MAG: YbaK/EbsC family protein [archaeon]|nr:YbaK/EbsC family protein [archaeon]